jgi:tRNA G18 (ribose-2'-O)-methylase SpoU
VIHLVTAASDPAIAAYRHVGAHDWLVEHGLFVAEGRLVVERLITGGRYTIESLLVTPPAFTALEPRLLTLDTPVMVAPPALVKEITGFDFHRGCLALARREPRAAGDIAEGALLLGLEAVGNPDNVGGLFRTAAAFGVAALLIDGRTADPFYRKSIRTSMGAVLDTPFATIDDWAVEFDRLRHRGYRVIALTPATTAEPLHVFVQRAGLDRALMIVGAEGSGLSQAVLRAADNRVSIPTTSAVDSLNVTVAAGVALAGIAEAHRVRGDRKGGTFYD